MKCHQAICRVKTRIAEGLRTKTGVLRTVQGHWDAAEASSQVKRFKPAPHSESTRELPAYGLIELKLWARFALFLIVGRTLIPIDGVPNRRGCGGVADMEKNTVHRFWLGDTGDQSHITPPGQVKVSNRQLTAIHAHPAQAAMGTLLPPSPRNLHPI